jgi:adenylate cyclase
LLYSMVQYIGMPQSRQLAAIMFTDIVGYTALMGQDEDKAFDLLKKNREIQKPLVEQYGGRWIKELGDGALASFPNATDAVLCAGAILQSVKKIQDLSFVSAFIWVMLCLKTMMYLGMG